MILDTAALSDFLKEEPGINGGNGAVGRSWYQ